MSFPQYGSNELPAHDFDHPAFSHMNLSASEVGILKPYRPFVQPDAAQGFRPDMERSLHPPFGSIPEEAPSTSHISPPIPHFSGVPQASSSARQPPPNLPTSLTVVCGPIKGILVIAKGKILVDIGTPDEREVSPTEFERLGGRAPTKKWKQSIRVVNDDGSVGRPVGEWLQAASLDIRANTLSILPPGSARPLSQGQPRMVQVRQVQRQAAEQTAEVSKQVLAAHMQKIYMGYLPGDPDFTLPHSLPPLRSPSPQGSLLQCIDLNSCTMEELLALAAPTTGGHDPYGSAMLPTHPGVLVGREAYVTGQEPPRRRQAQARSRTEALALLGEYLGGKIPEVPWEALGISKPPMIGNRPIDLRNLYNLVESMGGSDAVMRGRMWPVVAEHMGYGSVTGESDNVVSTLRMVYQKVLLHFEKQQRAINSFNRRDTTSQSLQRRPSHEHELASQNLQRGPPHNGALAAVQNFSRRPSHDGELAAPQDLQRRPSHEGELPVQSFSWRPSHDGELAALQNFQRRPSHEGEVAALQNFQRRPSHDGELAAQSFARRPSQDGELAAPQQFQRRPSHDGELAAMQNFQRRPSHEGELAVQSLPRRPSHDGQLAAAQNYQQRPYQEADFSLQDFQPPPSYERELAALQGFQPQPSHAGELAPPDFHRRPSQDGGLATFPRRPSHDGQLGLQTFQRRPSHDGELASFQRRPSHDGDLASFQRRPSHEGELALQNFQGRPSPEAELAALQALHRRPSPEVEMAALQGYTSREGEQGLHDSRHRTSYDGDVARSMAGVPYHTSPFQHLDPLQDMQQGASGLVTLEISRPMSSSCPPAAHDLAAGHVPTAAGEELSSYATGTQHLLEPQEHQTSIASGTFFEGLDGMGATSAGLTDVATGGLDSSLHGFHQQGGSGGMLQEEDAETHALLMHIQASSGGDYDDQLDQYMSRSFGSHVQPPSVADRQNVFSPSRHPHPSRTSLLAPHPHPSPSAQSEFALLETLSPRLGGHGVDASETGAQHAHHRQQQYSDGPVVPPAGGAGYGQQAKRPREEYENLGESKRMAF